MYKSQSSTQTAAALDSLKSDLPTVNIQHYAAAGAGLARITANVVHTAASRKDPSLVSRALRDKFNGQLQAVAGSLKIADTGPVSETITGLVSCVRESIAVASSDDMKGFTAVAANMYLDDEERMWTLNTTAAGQLMVRTTGIDDDQALIGLLNAVASSAPTSSENVRLSAIASSVRAQVEGGKLVSYVNGNNELGFGVVVATDADSDAAVVLPYEKGSDAEQISVNAVTEVHETPNEVLPDLTEDEQIQIAVASGRGAVDLEMLLDYYRKMFIRNPEYFEEFARRLRSHVFA